MKHRPSKCTTPSTIVDTFSTRKKPQPTFLLAHSGSKKTRKQPIMIVFWARTWADAAKYQYIFNIIEATFANYLPRWRMFVENLDGLLENTLRRRAPSVWRGQPVIGFMSDTDFEDSAGFPPMWSYPPTAVNNSTDNVTFGMGVTHFCENPTTVKHALIAQCPIVCFKASTVLQSMP